MLWFLTYCLMLLLLLLYHLHIERVVSHDISYPRRASKMIGARMIRLLKCYSWPVLQKKGFIYLKPIWSSFCIVQTCQASRMVARPLTSLVTVVAVASLNVLAHLTSSSQVGGQIPLTASSRSGATASQQFTFVSDKLTREHLSYEDHEGVGHFSEWSRTAKHSFLDDLKENQAQEWTIVMGNEGGDLDSMVSSLTWAYHLSHLEKPQKAIALLQTDYDALDLRPENQLALHYARMASRHRDLLTIEELPIQPWDLYHRVKGVALVDHNSPRTMWSNMTILSIIDHHVDQNKGSSASPRTIEKSASCSSLVARHILDYMDDHISANLSFLHGPFPEEAVDLLLRTIALDTSGLREDSTQPIDYEMASRLLQLSSWKDKDLVETMKSLDKDLSEMKKDLHSLTVRDLLRRDWKGDTYKEITLGFASVPISLEDQIARTPEQTVPEWFAIERAWTAEVGADATVSLSKYKDKDGVKYRQIALVVAHGWGKRLDEKAAARLFKVLIKAIESIPELDLEKWHRPDGKPLLPRRAVWTHTNQDAGRKVIRPVCEKAIREWSDGGN